MLERQVGQRHPRRDPFLHTGGGQSGELVARPVWARGGEQLRQAGKAEAVLAKIRMIALQNNLPAREASSLAHSTPAA
jgi:hypothetical protein